MKREKGILIGTIFMLEDQKESLYQWQRIQEPFDHLKNEIEKHIVGNQEAINYMLIALLCNGHVLLEGVPGIAKTTMIKTIAHALGLSFKRIQFTPDLLPADLIGTLIFNQKTQDFETKKGPIFANLILADEINRAPAKVQSALLESMQEHQVTIGSSTHILEEPFFVFATQNPLEQQGTYQLPEAQIDRFMFKILINYPTQKEERDIISRVFHKKTITQILSHEEIFSAQHVIEHIYIDTKIIDYITTIVHATRTPKNFGIPSLAPYIQHGASPRATLCLYRAAQAYAFMEKRQFVTPDDVKRVAIPILRHRLILSFQAYGEDITTDTVISEILRQLTTP
jgi:MoxR-like ATPase